MQTNILHCLSDGTQLAWLIDLIRQQVWVWQSNELPLIYSSTDPLPTLAALPALTVNDLIAMTQR